MEEREVLGRIERREQWAGSSVCVRVVVVFDWVDSGQMDDDCIDLFVDSGIGRRLILKSWRGVLIDAILRYLSSCAFIEIYIRCMVWKVTESGRISEVIHKP